MKIEYSTGIEIGIIYSMEMGMKIDIINSDGMKNMEFDAFGIIWIKINIFIKIITKLLN